MFSINHSSRILHVIDSLSSLVKLEDITIEFLLGNDHNNTVTVSKESVADWELKRARATIPALRRLEIAIEDEFENCENVERLLKELHLAQIKLLDIFSLKQELSWQTTVSNYITYGWSACYDSSFSNPCSILIRVPSCDTAKFVAWITKIFKPETLEQQAYCLIACPDHYMFRFDKAKNQLHIEEVTGGSSLICDYHVKEDDASGLHTAGDNRYPYQLIGTFYTEDGIRSGGMRYQFRDMVMDKTEIATTKTETVMVEVEEGKSSHEKKEQTQYCEALLTVDFPTYVSQYMIDEHQYHLACEWMRWFQIFLILQQEEMDQQSKSSTS